MSRYKMDDGTVIDTKNSIADWDEARRWDGQNMISVASGSQWHHEKLRKSRKGRYYIEYESQWGNCLPRADWISKRAAAAWLLANGHGIPDDLAAEADAVSE